MTKFNEGDRVITLADGDTEKSLFVGKVGTVISADDTPTDGWPYWVMLDEPPIAPTEVLMEDWDGSFGFAESELSALA